MNAAPPPAALALAGVEAAYGPFRALFGVDLTVPAGGAVAVIGPNGAGKTTLARVATGLVTPVAGSVAVAGEDMTGEPPHRFARAGVLGVPEGRAVLGTLNVAENLALVPRRPGQEQPAPEEAFGWFPRLGERRSQPAGTLSGGEQRMLALAVALLARPMVLVADELSLGLGPSVVADVYRHLVRLRESGTALVVVEQRPHPALEVCDDVMVLDRGSLRWVGPAARAPRSVLAAWAGPGAG